VVKLHLRAAPFEQVLNWAIAVAFVASVGTWAWYFQHRGAQAPSDPSTETYAIGEPFPDIGVSFQDSDQSLVMFVMSTCPVCTDSMPFYNEVQRTRDAVQAHLPLVAISFESQRALDGYLSAHAFHPDVARSVSPTVIKLRRTPTLLLVGRDQKVREVWRGRLSPERQEDLLKAALHLENPRAAPSLPDL
jgi:hypothetical protein